MKILVCSHMGALNRFEDPEFQFFPEENIKKIESKFDVVWNDLGRQFTTEELIERIADCDAILTCWGSNPLTEEIVKHAPKLKIMAHMAGSVAYVASEALYDKGVKVIGANDTMFAESVAEGALSYALVALRKINQVVTTLDKERTDGWSKVFPIRGLIDRTVGIVSFGAIAEHFVRMLQPFHCKIKVYSRSISDEKLQQYNMERASLEEICSTCDVISIHTAWNKHTEKMIDKRLLQMIKKNAVLVNTARGQVIDEEALIEELKTGRFYAALDVFCEEPLPMDSPFYDMENVLVMPHHGGPTQDRYRFIASKMIDEVYDYLVEGKAPLSEISKERGLSMTIG